MSEPTLYSPPVGAAEPQSDGGPKGWACKACGQTFAVADARFCPFDGEPLAPAPRRAADPLIGTVIDQRYRVESQLGEGGMGSVYLVEHVALRRKLALKVLRRDLAREPELAQRFIQEARAAASVPHPAVVEITDFGVLEGGVPYFVMELVPGRPLAWWLRKGGPMPASRAVRIARDVAEALGAAHAAGVVHRDLKPDNIHVSEVAGDALRVKVLDFGLARVAGQSRLTRDGMVFGTPHYMSPEQAGGDAVDHRADIYALGIVMYEMFTGRVPFEADTYMGVLTKHLYMVPTPPSQVLSTAELGAVEDVVLRCLEKKPAARYQSMAELADALQAALTVRARPPAGRAPRHRRPTPRSLLADELEAPGADEMRVARRSLRSSERPWYLWVAAGAAAMAVGGLLAWLARPGAPPPSAAAADAVSGVALAPAEPASTPTFPPPTAAAVEPPPPVGATTGERRAAPVHAPGPRSAPKASPAPAPAPAVAPHRPKAGGGEIVDPWAQ